MKHWVCFWVVVLGLSGCLSLESAEKKSRSSVEEAQWDVTSVNSPIADAQIFRISPKGASYIPYALMNDGRVEQRAASAYAHVDVDRQELTIHVYEFRPSPRSTKKLCPLPPELSALWEKYKSTQFCQYRRTSLPPSNYAETCEITLAFFEVVEPQTGFKLGEYIGCGAPPAIGDVNINPCDKNVVYEFKLDIDQVSSSSGFRTCLNNAVTEFKAGSGLPEYSAPK